MLPNAGQRLDVVGGEKMKIRRKGALVDDVRHFQRLLYIRTCAVAVAEENKSGLIGNE